MWAFLNKVLGFFMFENRKELKKISQQLLELKEQIMTVQQKVQEAADQIDATLVTAGAALQNLANDITSLTGQLANAPTEAQVTAILQPKVDALKAFADQLSALAAVVPEAPVNPPTEL